MFGAWNRIAENGSKVTAPLAVYVYTRSQFPVTVASNYNQTWQGYWGQALNLSKLDLDKPLYIDVGYKGESYRLVFVPVKELKEKEKEKAGLVSLDKVREWLDREAQYATVLAASGILAALGVKRKTLLMRTFNVLNLGIILGLGAIVYSLARETGHSGWLTAVLASSYMIAYSIIPVGRRLYLIKIIPSLRKIIWERAVIYRTSEGLQAYARQTVGEAVKRLLGRHIIVKDAEIGKLGELASDKIWSVEDVEFYEKSDGLLVLDAKLTREKIEPGGGDLA